MKYKDRKDAKRKYKQALLATVATMSLGVSTLGGTTSAFAEEKSTPTSDFSKKIHDLDAAIKESLKHNPNPGLSSLLNSIPPDLNKQLNEIKEMKKPPVDQDYDEWWGLKKFTDNCLTVSDNKSITQVANQTITSNGYEQINSYHYTNKTGKVESAHKTPTLNHDVTRKLSLTKGQEFSFGQEISIESGKLSELVAKMSAKATAGQKFTSSTTEETLITDKVTYGGNTYELDPGDTIDVIYRIQNTRTNGTLKTASQIDFNLDGRYGLRYLTQEELDYANKEHSLPTSTNRYTGSSPSLAHFFGVLLGYPGVVKPGAVAVALDYYDVYDGNTGRHKNDAYVMNLNTLKKAFTIDGNNDRSKVYLNQTTADFTLDDQSVNIIVDVSITNPKTSKNKTYSNIVENPIITQ